MTGSISVNTHSSIWRLNVVRLVFVCLAIGLTWRLADIQVINPDFLRDTRTLDVS